MPATGKYIARFTNPNVNPLNFQLVDFDINNSVETVAMAAARIIGYLCQADVMAAGTILVSLDFRAFGSAGGVPIPFPVSEYSAVDAAAVADGFTTAPRAVFPCPVGTSGTVLCPLGTSISVSEVSGVPGPTGRGRHFLPFINASTVLAGGTLDGTYVTAVQNAYNEFFLNNKPGGGGIATAPLDAGSGIAITNVTGTPMHDVIVCKAQPVFSNLESRRR